jgi:hypothetical protein
MDMINVREMKDNLYTHVRFMALVFSAWSACQAMAAQTSWIEVPSVVAPSASLLVGTAHGSQNLANRPRVYRGFINDTLPAMQVVCGAERLVVVYEPQGVRAYWDGNGAAAGAVEPYVPTPAFDCLPRTAPNAKVQNHDGWQGTDDGLGLRVRIAVEADYEYFASAGQRSAERALAYTTALFMVVRDVYENEANISFEISWFKVWADSAADPYKVKGNAYALPDVVRPYWKEHYDTVQRDLAHIMTSVGYGGGGFGYLGALCNREYGFAVSSPTGLAALPQFGFTYDAYIVGHEIGHNFDARHTHDCFWEPALDTCYTKDDVQLALGDACYSLPITPRRNAGSWLSYCANANYALSGNDFSQFKLDMTLLPQVAAFIRATADAAVSTGCLPVMDEPLLYLRRPLGGIDVEGGSMLTIAWGHRNVAAVNVDVSSNFGSTWQAVEHGVAAGVGMVVWLVNNADVPAVFVRVSDVNDDRRFDVISVPLRVRASTSAPAEGTATEFGAHDGVVNVPEGMPTVVSVFDMQGRLHDRQSVEGGQPFGLPQAGGTWLITMQQGTRVVARLVNTGGVSRSAAERAAAP